LPLRCAVFAIRGDARWDFGSWPEYYLKMQMVVFFIGGKAGLISRSSSHPRFGGWCDAVVTPASNLIDPCKPHVGKLQAREQKKGFQVLGMRWVPPLKNL